MGFRVEGWGSRQGTNAHAGQHALHGLCNNDRLARADVFRHPPYAGRKGGQSLTCLGSILKRYELLSKLLEGGYVGDYTGDYYRRY